MILIIEGADLVGKSTLATRVSAASGWPVALVRWPLAGDPAAETRGMAAATLGILRATRPNVIFDRIYFSWWAYGPALGHAVSFMPELIRRFTRVTEVTDARLVLLTASPEELQRRYARQPDAYFSLDVIQQANARFPSLLSLLPESLPALHLDTSATVPDDVFQLVEAFLHGTEGTPAEEAVSGRR